MSKILVTGAFGQIGSELIPALQKKYGYDNVIASDIREIENPGCIAEIFDITDTKRLNEVLDQYQIDTVYHLVSLLSARGEQDPTLTWNVNIGSLKTFLDIAKERKIKLFWPSSIAAFGPTTPRDHTPQQTILEPTTMYGVTKVAGELLCRYYHLKLGVDVRTVRYPGLISWKAEPGGGTTDFAVAIFYEAIKNGKYDCFVKSDTALPMMYMDDAVRGTIELMDADLSVLPYKPYNLSALSFTAAELADEINKRLPIAVTYTPDFRQAIADSWPCSIDDSEARLDWHWHHEFDLSTMTDVMLDNLKTKLRK